MATLYWSARNPGRIECEKHMGNSTFEKISAFEAKWILENEDREAKCEDCGATL
jgi:hypothetical protein